MMRQPWESETCKNEAKVGRLQGRRVRVSETDAYSAVAPTWNLPCSVDNLSRALVLFCFSRSSLAVLGQELHRNAKLRG